MEKFQSPESNAQKQAMDFLGGKESHALHVLRGHTTRLHTLNTLALDDSAPDTVKINESLDELRAIESDLAAMVQFGGPETTQPVVDNVAHIAALSFSSEKNGSTYGNASREFALSFLANQISTLRDELRVSLASPTDAPRDPYRIYGRLAHVAGRCLLLVEHDLYEFKREGHVRELVEMMEDIYTSIGFIGQENRESYATHAGILHDMDMTAFLFRYGGDGVSLWAHDELIEDILRGRAQYNPGVIEMAVRAFDGEAGDGIRGLAARRCKKLFDSIISSTGQSSERMLVSWLTNNDIDFLALSNALRLRRQGLIHEMGPFFGVGRRAMKVVGENLQAIEGLRRAYGDAPKILHSEFGIVEYGRYPSNILLRQYEERDEQKPYGVIFYPRSDFNGGFRVQEDMMSNFSAELKKLGFALRIVEANGKRDFARRLITLDRRYAQGSGKIRFAVIGGHGQKDSIQFGEEGTTSNRPVEHELNSGDLHMGKGIQRAGSFFTGSAPVVLVSCSTGKNEGIGQRLSEVFNTKVVAPDESTMILSITPSLLSGGRLDLDAKYARGTMSKVYAGGKESDT